MGNVQSGRNPQTGEPAGRRVWIEFEAKVLKYIRFEQGGGKTGKGLLYFWSNAGGRRCFDVEDIIYVSSSPRLSRN